MSHKVRRSAKGALPNGTRARSNRSRSLSHERRPFVKWHSQFTTRRGTNADVYTPPHSSVMKRGNDQETTIVDEVSANSRPRFSYQTNDFSSMPSRSPESCHLHREIFAGKDLGHGDDRRGFRAISTSPHRHRDVNSPHKASYHRIRSRERVRSRSSPSNSPDFHLRRSRGRSSSRDPSRSLGKVRYRQHRSASRGKSTSGRGVKHASSAQRPVVPCSRARRSWSVSPPKVATSEPFSPRQSKPTGVHFNVHVDRVRGALRNIPAPPSRSLRLYVVLRTSEKRARTDVLKVPNTHLGDDLPFNSTFRFPSFHPDRDFLSLTLMAASASPDLGPRMIAKCRLALPPPPGCPFREVEAVLVRHPGRPTAYESGAVDLRISFDGPGPLPSASASSPVFSPSAGDFSRERAAVRDVLCRYAPDRLHRLDFYVGGILKSAGAGGEGPTKKGLRAAFAEWRRELLGRSRQKEATGGDWRLVVREVRGLSRPEGGPLGIGGCRLVVRPRGAAGVAKCSKMVRYHRQAVFNWAFQVDFAQSPHEGLTIEVFSGTQKLSELEVGLFNLQAGVTKEVSGVLVCVAGSKHAAHGGEISFTLRAENYTSALLLSSGQERRLRERVLGFLWCYRRTELHRLEVILAEMKNPEKEMREWERIYGPEPLPSHLSMCLCHCRNIFPAGVSDLADFSEILGGPRKLYAWVSAGPTTTRTEFALSSNGCLSFMTSLDFTLYFPEREVVKLLLIEEIGFCDREVSRVEFGLSALYKGATTLRCLHLVAHARTSAAFVRGEIDLELTAQDFDIPAGKVTDGAAERSFFDRMEAAIWRSAPEDLHRVALIVDRTPAYRREAFLSEILALPTINLTTAPMTLQIVGMKDYPFQTDDYLKVYLNDRLILRTRTYRGTPHFRFDVDDPNETTVRLSCAREAVLRFEVKRRHRLGADPTLARGGLALATMGRGRPNPVWLRLWDTSCPERAGSPTPLQQPGPCPTGKAFPLHGERPSTTPGGAGLGGFAGYLGMRVESVAFPVPTGEDSTACAIAHDVETLLRKFCPQCLPHAAVLISRCWDAYAAHWELRARLFRGGVGLTVFLTVEGVEGVGGAGEEVLVNVDIAGDKQWTRRGGGDDPNLVDAHSRWGYPPIRLDLPNPEALEGVDIDTPRNRLRSFHAPLELRLLRLRDKRTSLTGIQDFQHSRAALPRRDPFGAAFDATNGRESSPVPHRPSTATHSQSGNKNHISTYLDDPISFLVASEIRGWQSGATGSSLSYRKPRNDSRSLANSYHASLKPLVSSSAEVDEIGLVKLSLRALLSRPPQHLNDSVRVPVISSSFSSSRASPSRSTALSSTYHENCVVGFITFRLSLPAFEVVPAWIKLDGWNIPNNHYHRTEGVNLARAFDDKRHISAYLNNHSPTDLVDFHYKFYEHKDNPVRSRSSVSHV
ncbi:unnamed protein product [Phytomonas sp. Hart1]|nr:unnamed protein product [Phytomonas sp. Hart1]|eukprot:CCW69867.1 unnamed protein product [Phytomonas sp. isolate Hart1]